MPPFMMASTRFLVAGFVLGGFLWMTRSVRVTIRQVIDNAIIGALLLLGGTGTVSWAETSIPSGMTTLIVSLNPIITVLAEWGIFEFLKDEKRGARPTWLTFVGLALGLLGLVLLVGPSLSEEGSTHLELVPVLALVFACCCWTAGSLYSRYANNPVDPMVGSAIQMILGGLWIGIVAGIAREHVDFEIQAISWRSWFAWSYLVVAGSLVAFSTYLWLMKHSTPTLVSTYAYVNPIVAVFLGWWLLNEVITMRVFVAATIIIAGVATITTAKARANRRLQAMKSKEAA